VPVRVVTWNVLGACADHRVQDGIADRLRDLAPDVVALQEARRPLACRVARRGGFPARAFVAKRRDLRLPTHQEGLATLTRRPVRHRARHDLRGGRRVALDLTVEVDGVDVRIVNAHLDTDVGERATNVDALLRAAAPAGGPVAVVVGDLNTKPRAAGHPDRAYETLVAAGYVDALAALRPDAADPAMCPGDVRREPAPGEAARCGYTNWHDARRAEERGGEPRHRLDHVLVPRDAGIVVERVWTPADDPGGLDAFRPLSDHLPVVADLRVG
jgi:endonuclease/exonuclease/phosphatase family metal-dependent hydrolase